MASTFPITFGAIAASGSSTFDWTPLDETGRIHFVDITDAQITESGGTISAVNNQSDLGFSDWNTAAITNEPTYVASYGTGQAAEMDGSDNYFKTATTVDLTGGLTNFTQVLLWEPLTGIADNSIAFDVANFNTDATWQLNLRSSAVGNSMLPAHSRVGGGVNARQSSSVPALDTPHWTIITHKLGAAGTTEIDKIYLDGADDTGSYFLTGDNAAGGFGDQIHYLGCRGGISLFSKFRLISYILWDHEISGTVISNIDIWAPARLGL